MADDEKTPKRSSFLAQRLGFFRRDRRGVTAIEYAMIAGIITVAIMGSLLSTVAPNLDKTFNTVSSEL